MSRNLPLVGVTACRILGDHTASHRVGEKYVTAMSEIAGVCPVIIPALPGGVEIDALLERLDGVFLTGSPSNVEPSHYDGGASATPDDHDPARDGVTLALARAAVARGVPLLGVCRGAQELNVAFGGTLVQEVHRDTGGLDHRMRRDVAYDWKYRPAHSLDLVAGGRLAAIAGPGPHLVNSLHGQAIDRPGERVVVEGRAPDGVVEAISIADAGAFALAVQWHPEWPRPAQGINRALFQAFGDAARAHADGHRTRVGVAAE
ncbi:MAG: gamma-glutamyl-gamma-aminobutyrate hydrolase family protein [Thalassobaculaceae bacterium]|nr:gamma-glutamyl-gamma-aminobutyrate hydrolase family protein [Thalassobaculaceae bacterium]